MRRSERLIPTAVGAALVLMLSTLLYFTPGPVRKVVDFLERATYDWRVRHYHKPLPQDTPIVIVDIDDESLNEVGRWPWPRSVIGTLAAKLFNAGAKEIVFDAMFPDKNRPEEDALFAKDLAKGGSILGFALKDTDEKVGILPKPLFSLSQKEVDSIDEKTGYLSNIALLEQSSLSAGFLNASPDSDGVLRSTPILMRRGSEVYGSLGLIGAFYYLGAPGVQLVSASYHDEEVLEGVLIGDRFVPIDPRGRSLIPFRGLPYSFPYVSASSVLGGKIAKDAFEGKLVFIGTSATSLGDLNPTAIFPVFAGVEIQASVAQGVLDGYFPYRPSWALGAQALFLFVFGLVGAFVFPLVNLPIRIFLALAFPAILLFVSESLWFYSGIVLSMTFPIGAVEILFLMNLIWGYFFESKRRHQIRSLFSQYISNDRIDQILLQETEVGLQGESKELTVLFADIRGFTSIAEKLDAHALKLFLTDFFTPMTEVIFKHRGTVDKYVGDLIMAFWGAPIDDPLHALHAVECAMEMQRRLKELNEDRQKKGEVEIHIGIGLNTGIMSVGDMGSRFRKAYTVLGDPVNLASRLESLSKYYQASILVGEATVQKTGDKIAYRQLDRVKVAGKQIAVNIFEPIEYLTKLSEDDRKKIEQTDLALKAYFSRDWLTAANLFSKLAKDDPVWTSIFLQRIEERSKDPPPENWDGAFVLENK